MQKYFGIDRRANCKWLYYYFTARNWCWRQDLFAIAFFCISLSLSFSLFSSHLSETPTTISSHVKNFIFHSWVVICKSEKLRAYTAYKYVKDKLVFKWTGFSCTFCLSFLLLLLYDTDVFSYLFMVAVQYASILQRFYCNYCWPKVIMLTRTKNDTEKCFLYFVVRLTKQLYAYRREYTIQSFNFQFKSDLWSWFHGSFFQL